ncbi:MAG: DegT/DnrJ/EryC1/StrS family aminotransferase [Deltaproteobacteria bacterium]|jgi:dTDP-4-amino-4,6-dideoxygalactose transaminase|nr:DegT/DnrJ/EryC1/StrS family aminotransferase [Deltaproteobacteria bacterium]
MSSEYTSTWKYLLSDIDFDEYETNAVLNVLNSKWLSMGPKTKEFEKDFGRYADVPFALATANCTTALHMALICLGIGQGDEVIVPSLTFVATSNSVLYAGARPVFADISSLDCPLIDPQDIEKKVTPNTKAIIVMHYAGYPCDMGQITALAKKHNLFIIEDAAHGVGSFYGERMCGTIGDIGCFSFFANKNLPVGEGGMLVTRDREIYDRAARLRSHGMTSLTWDRVKGHAYSYDVVDLGYNYRPTEISGAIGLTQLQKLPGNNEKRNEIFKEYIKMLSNNEHILLPFSETGADGRYARHLFPVVLNEDINRESFIAKLRDYGIQTSIHYPPVHKFSYYQAILEEDQTQGLNNTEAYGKRVVTLPMHPMLTRDDVKEICKCLELSLKASS